MEIPANVKVYDFSSAVMWLDEAGILCSVSKKAPAQTVEEARETLEEFKKITGGRKVCMLLDITNSQPNTKEIRDFAAEEIRKIAKAIAMISSSALGKMIANLYFGLKPPTYPAKMFTNEQDARNWLKQYL